MQAFDFTGCVHIMETNRANGGRARAAVLSADERKAVAKKAAEARWGRKATHKGSFIEDLGIDADCYVLDDEQGTAVVSMSGMSRMLGYVNDRAKSIARLLDRESVRAHLSANSLEKINNPLKFQYVDRAAKRPPFTAKGYDATVIIDVCNAVIAAGKCDPSIKSEQIASASVIIGACAKTGIRELIYKIAGYSSTKAQVIAAFRQFVQEETSKWAKEFPDELYSQWQRIYEIPVPEKGRNWEHRHLTIKQIYYPLAHSNGVLLSLLRQAKGDQRSKKLHQFLNEVGKDALRAHIWKVVGIAAGSRNREEYERAFAYAFGGQLPLEFESILE